MDRTDAKMDLAVVAGGAVAAVTFFWAVYAPGLLTAPPGGSFRPMALLPLLAFVCGYGWPLACAITGGRFLLARRYRYGLTSLGIGAAQFAAVPLAMWLLMRARGIEWGS